MRNLLTSIALAIVAFVAVSCTTAQTDKFVSGLNNFNRGVAAVDETIKAISATLYANCKSIQAISQTASDISGQCSKAGSVLSAGNTAINSMCQSSQVVDITSTVVASGAAYKSVKTQLASAKASCANGG